MRRIRELAGECFAKRQIVLVDEEPGSGGPGPLHVPLGSSE
jgi:hypothetical protein